MPIYDYKCNGCGVTSEIFLKGADGSGVSCPQCGSADMERSPISSYSIRTQSRPPGTTCCGRTERCEAPGSTGRACCGSG